MKASKNQQAFNHILFSVSTCGFNVPGIHLVIAHKVSFWRDLVLNNCSDCFFDTGGERYPFTVGMIRKYENQDMGGVVNIWKLASAQAHSFLNADFAVQAERDLQEVYLLKTDTWVYDLDGATVGFISMLNNEIGGLFVIPRFQGKGIGSALVNYVATKFSELAVEVFDRNKLGRRFYEKYGFKLVKIYFHKESSETVRRLNFLKSAE